MEDSTWLQRLSTIDTMARVLVDMLPLYGLGHGFGRGFGLGRGFGRGRGRGRGFGRGRGCGHGR